MATKGLKEGMQSFESGLPVPKLSKLFFSSEECSSCQESKSASQKSSTSKTYNIDEMYGGRWTALQHGVTGKPINAGTKRGTL